MKSSSKTSKDENKENESVKSNNIINNIKSRLILSKIYDNIPLKQKLGIVKYNKKIQNKLNLNIKDYKEYIESFSSIIIEIILCKNVYGRFIKINENEKLYYHIYFNDNKEEIKNKYEIKEDDKVTKIKIIIDYQVKSFNFLFSKCECIESINFKQFYRNNIKTMSMMFYCCSSLKEINLSNFNTNNVTDMSWMFYGCSLLKELNLSNFNTNNVNNMCSMFYKCSSLKEIKFLNFCTNKVTDMNYMFYGCSSLKELNLSNFKTNNVIDMFKMFYGCSSLKDINISNFKYNKVINMKSMFYGCSNDLKVKIMYQIKNIREEAFLDDNVDN
jgi:surface protein